VAKEHPCFRPATQPRPRVCGPGGEPAARSCRIPGPPVFIVSWATGEVQMRARTETIELGERVSRALTMENSGPVRRRIWWIVSSAVLAPFSGPQAGGRTMGPDLTSASIDTATGRVRYVFDEAEDDDRSRWPGPRRSPPRAPPSTPGAPCASLDAADPSAAQPSCPRAGQLLEARATSRRGSAFLGSAGMVAHPPGPGQLTDVGRDVNGQQDLPVGGQEISRPVDSRIPGGRTADLRVRVR
jgi:hypothetical protein